MTSVPVLVVDVVVVAMETGVELMPRFFVFVPVWVSVFVVVVFGPVVGVDAAFPGGWFEVPPFVVVLACSSEYFI